MSKVFHDHLDVCAQCREHPMDLCIDGARLLRAATAVTYPECSKCGRDSMVPWPPDGNRMCAFCGHELKDESAPVKPQSTPVTISSADLFAASRAMDEARRALITNPQNFTGEFMSEEEFQKAKDHFDVARKIYQELEGTPGCNTTLALRLVFDPLAKRYNNGERSQELYDEMMAVE